MEQVDLLITGGTVITQNAQRETLAGAAVAVRKDRIVAVLPAGEAQRRYVARRTVDATGRFVFPGLISTHTHLFQTFMKGLGEGLPLYEWITAVTAPSTFAMNARDGYLSAALGGLESLHCGTTTVVDYMYSLPTPDLYREVARAFGDLGLRGVLGWGLTETGERYGQPAFLLKPVSQALAECEAMAGELETRLVTLALAPGIIFGVTPAGFQLLRRHASEHGMLIMLHLNEADGDDRATLADYGQRAVPFLESLGFWGPDVLAVHCIRMAPEDIEIFVRHDVKVSHNPVSNMYLGCGIAPIVEMRRAGLTVGLGPDGAASNNSQDMIETMKAAGLLPKLAHQDPGAMTAAQVLDMATIEGARAIGQEDRLGSIEPGKQADLFIFDPLRPKSAPVLDPVASLVYSAGQDSVVTTVVAGRVVLDGGRVTTVDEAALLAECQAAAWDLARRAGTTRLLSR